MLGRGISFVAELMPSLRVILGMIQVMSGMQFAFSVPFPTAFGFLIDQLRLLSLDFLGAFRLGCANDVWDFYRHFFASILIVPVSCGVAFALYIPRPKISFAVPMNSPSLMWDSCSAQVCLPARPDQDAFE